VKPRDTVFLRVALLLLAAVVLMQLATYAAIRQFGRGPATELVSSAIADRLVPARRGAAVGNGPLEIRPAAPPASAGGPVLPFDRGLVRRLLAKLPAGSEVRVSAAPADRTLWVRTPDTDGWMQVSGFGQARRALSILLTTAIVAGLLVLAGSAVAARLLTRPLTRLAERAPELVMGRSESLPRGPWEVRRLGRSLLETAHRRAEAERERELLLAGISHDLRAPLSRLRLRAQMADDSDAFDEDIDEMEAIVDSFIGYVRDGRDEAAERVDLAGWAAGVAEPYRERGLAVNAEPCRAAIRPLALKRAVVNLLENAFAHGRPPVELTVAARDDGCAIAVADRGDGLAADRLESALRPFETFDAARGSRHSGLGLATVERIASAHGGVLRLENRDGGGLRACIRLPANG
jgi:two-component system osmolarity sensor histidine kinase EnvZ